MWGKIQRNTLINTNCKKLKYKTRNTSEALKKHKKDSKMKSY